MSIESLRSAKVLTPVMLIVFVLSYFLGKGAGLLPFLEPRSFLWSGTVLSSLLLGVGLFLYTAIRVFREGKRPIKYLIQFIVAYGILCFSAGLVLATP